MTQIPLLGFSHSRPFLFLLFLATHLVALLGNSATLALVLPDPHLHNPTYFFLSHVSWLDICYFTATVPEVPAGSLRPRASISYRGCPAQTFFPMSCAAAEWHCWPSRPTTAAQPSRSPALRAHRAPGRGRGLPAVGMLGSRLSFCRAARLRRLFCNVPPPLGAACGDTRPSEAALHAFVAFGPFLLVLGSDLRIVAAALAVPAAAGRHKAFSPALPTLVLALRLLTANLNPPAARAAQWPRAQPRAPPGCKREELLQTGSHWVFWFIQSKLGHHRGECQHPCLCDHLYSITLLIM